LALTHSNVVIHGGQTPPYASLSFACLDCHDPHFHNQLVNLPGLFLVTATIDPDSIVDNGNNTSTLSYSSATIKDGWNLPPHADNADWGAKTSAGRGLILVADKDNPEATYEILSATATQITVNGVMSTSFEDNTFGIMYGMLLNEEVDPDGEGGNSPVTVRFYDKSGANSFADGDTTYDGVCEVCHTQTDHFRADGTVNVNPGINMDHTAATDCTDCHTHEQGFGLSGGDNCASCHPDWGSHPTHTEAEYGPQLACYDCHDTNNYPLLADGQDLANTTVCDTCHSAGGSYNGVDSSGDSIGARDNWVEGIYDSGMNIQAGKERWCVGCHDDIPAVIQGVSAPNVAGDDIDYGYYQTGHGKHGNEQAIGCLDCHDASMVHTDGEARTYTAAADNYQAGYRLKDIDGQAPMDIPRSGGASASQFRLCFTCHDSDPFLNMSSTSTNFRKDVNDDCVTSPASDMVNKHWYHLQSVGALNNSWDSDWDGATGDSWPSCPACHNVHGAKTKAGATNAPAMIRTGELIGRASALNLQYFENPCDNQTLSATNETANSTGGAFTGGGSRTIPGNGVCSMCHTVYSPYWREAKDIVGCSSNSCHTTGSHLTHVTSTADGGLLGLGCGECHNTDNIPQFKDGQDLAGTTACDNCHSANGVALAKQYWGNPGSSSGAAGSWAVVEGEASFCGSCHDATPGNTQADGLGDNAFNVLGDNATYGFYVTGHGKADGNYTRLSWQDDAAIGNPAANRGCGACHDLGSVHFDNAGKRLKAGYENDQDNSNCNQCHAPGNGATSDPQFYTISADYEKSAHRDKLCTECHDVHGAAAGGYPAMTLEDQENLCDNCHTNGSHPGVGTTTFTHSSKNYTLECVSCHNVHIVTGTYSQADQGKSPVTRFSDNTNVWGDVAGEKMNDYAGTGTYQTPNGESFTGDQLPDYASFCLDCHGQAGNPPFGLNWNNDPHGKNAANQPNGYGTCPNWYTCGKAESWDGDNCLADDGGGSDADCWPVMTRGKGDQLWSKSAFTHEGRIGGSNFTLSCTDCHTGHGTGNLGRPNVNGGTFSSTWNTMCGNCHYYYSDWHAGMSCGNASCHVSDRMSYPGVGSGNTPHEMNNAQGSGATRSFDSELVVHYAFENNLKDSGDWQMDGTWSLDRPQGDGSVPDLVCPPLDDPAKSGSYVAGKSGQAIEINDQPIEVGTENCQWSTNEGYHDTWKYTEMKYNMTLEAWVYPTDDTGSERRIMAKHTYWTGGYTLELAKIDGTWRAALLTSINGGDDPWRGSDCNGLRGAFSTVPVPLNEWTHVAATYDSAGPDRNINDGPVGRIRIYVNGEDVTDSYPDEAQCYAQPGAGEDAMFPHSDWNDIDPVKMCFAGDWCASALSVGGLNWSAPDDNFIGRLDEVKVWNVTKDASFFETADSQAPPRISAVKGLIGNSELTVTFSEGVYAGPGGSGALDAADFVLVDTNGDNPRTITGVAHVAGEPTAILTMSQPLAAADVDADTVAAAGSSVYDEYDNPADAATVIIGLSSQCPTVPVSIQLNEAPGSPSIMDDQNILFGSVSGTDTLTGSAYAGSGDGDDSYIDFQYNTTCLQATTAMTVETRIKPAGLDGTSNYIRRILARDSGGNYQLSVWRNNSWTNFNAPTGEASIALWIKVVDNHAGNAWKPVLTNYTGAATGAENDCPIVSDHWYQVKAVWNTNKPGGTPGSFFNPAEIWVDDQGTDGLDTGENWSGSIDCTDVDQSLKEDIQKFYTADEISSGGGTFTIGANQTNPANNVFNGLIDWITWKDSVD